MSLIGFDAHITQVLRNHDIDIYELIDASDPTATGLKVRNLILENRSLMSDILKYGTWMDIGHELINEAVEVEVEDE